MITTFLIELPRFQLDCRDILPAVLDFHNGELFYANEKKWQPLLAASSFANSAGPEKPQDADVPLQPGQIYLY